MQEKEPLQKARTKAPFAVFGILAVFFIMLLLLWVNTTRSQQSLPALFPDVYFEGQYRIGNGDWQPVTPGQHIPATQGDVTLYGQFHMIAPDGQYLGPAEAGIPLAFYTDHIHITVQEAGLPAYLLDIESSTAGNGLCGKLCSAYILETSQPITLTFHNPHRFGNANAIDDFLKELSVYADSSFEKEFQSQGTWERNMGLAFFIAGFVLLGTALFSTLLHIDGSSKLWLIGLCILFAGGYFIYGAKGVFFWSDSIIGNTTLLGICMMMYMLCICALIPFFLAPALRKLGIASVTFLGVACAALTAVCLLTDVRFYDTWLWWAAIQSIVNIILLICLAFSFPCVSKTEAAVHFGACILLLGYEADFVGTAFGWWRGGLVCQFIFVILFVIAIVSVWRVIPRNINASRKSKELEAEQQVIRAQLQESRMAIMISQIQPHFIYNTLGTIQHLCKEDPVQAGNLVQTFSLYLRGNFSELDNARPIRFTKELEHVRCYTGIELVRFPDMTVNYDIQAEDFLLPALTVQPLVENAIKHGLMGLEEGGTVTVTSYETATHYCVKVTDNGVGFDPAAPKDEQKHIGIRNVRERLQLMCGGSLLIESKPGSGTTALIQIPKEENEQ